MFQRTFTHVSIYLSNYLYIYLSVYLSISLSIDLPMYISTYLAIYSSLSVYQYIYLAPSDAQMSIVSHTKSLDQSNMSVDTPWNLYQRVTSHPPVKRLHLDFHQETIRLIHGRPYQIQVNTYLTWQTWRHCGESRR